MKLKRQRMAGVELLHALEKEAEQKRQKLVEASKDRKIFELLKEKQQLRHRQDIEKQDQKELDEVAVGSFRRKNPGSDGSTATPKS
jgi:flagellar export protein FliJ